MLARTQTSESGIVVCSMYLQQAFSPSAPLLILVRVLTSTGSGCARNLGKRTIPDTYHSHVAASGVQTPLQYWNPRGGVTDCEL